MKNLIIAIFIIAGLNSCSRTEIVISEKQLTDDVFYLPEDIKPYTGNCLIYYSGTKNFKEKLSFKKGILNGPVICFHENGKIKRKGEYREGKFDGKWEYWNETGGKIYEANYMNDTLSGDYTTWYPTGAKCEQGKYSENKRTGLWRMFDENGSVIKEKNYTLN
jgi:antitoxin component YwqK of YwqJK toxin-antitoxin module